MVLRKKECYNAKSKQINIKKAHSYNIIGYNKVEYACTC